MTLASFADASEGTAPGSLDSLTCVERSFFQLGLSQLTLHCGVVLRRLLDSLGIVGFHPAVLVSPR